MLEQKGCIEFAAVQREIKNMEIIGEKKECRICLNDEANAASGLECTAKHFTCADCLARYINTVCQGEALGRIFSFFLSLFLFFIIFIIIILFYFNIKASSDCDAQHGRRLWNHWVLSLDSEIRQK